MKTINIALSSPVIIAIILLIFKRELITGEAHMSASMAWTLIGTFLSYLGFCFSLFAVLEVRSLSGKYFAKQRLPEMKRQLEKITKNMASLGPSRVIEMRTERFVVEAAVVLKHIKTTKAPGFIEAVESAEREQKIFENLLAKYVDKNELNSDKKEYWNLFRALSRVIDEIEAHNKGVQASL